MKQLLTIILLAVVVGGCDFTPSQKECSKWNENAKLEENNRWGQYWNDSIATELHKIQLENLSGDTSDFRSMIRLTRLVLKCFEPFHYHTIKPPSQ